MMRNAEELRNAIHQASVRLQAALLATTHQLVLAESCTGGLVAASLTQLSGISDVFCGSLVTYQTPIKTQWLDIPAEEIEKYNVVSQEVADAMSLSSLQKTPVATLAASITGHLGPSEDPREGNAFIAIASQEEVVARLHHRFATYEADQRVCRQLEGTHQVISLLLRHLSV